MSPKLRAILNNVGTTTAGVTGSLVNVSSGKLLDDKLVVLAYMFGFITTQHQAFATPTPAGGAIVCSALQGVTDDNMLDLLITGMAFQTGFQNTTWDFMLATAKAALDGTAGLSPYDYKTLINYCLLSGFAGIIVL